MMIQHAGVDQQGINPAYENTPFFEFAKTRVYDKDDKLISFDVNLRNKITRDNQKLVSFVIDKFYSKIPDLKLVREDITQEGFLGLMDAIPRFEPEMGFRFSTYAIYYIQQAISVFLVSNKGSPSTPSHVRIAYNKLLKEAKKNEVSMKELVSTFSGGHKELGLSAKMMNNVRCSLNTRNVLSMDQPIGRSVNTGDGSVITLGESMVDGDEIPPDENLDRQMLVDAVKETLMRLNKRQRLILLLRFNLLAGGCPKRKIKKVLNAN